MDTTVRWTRDLEFRADFPGGESIGLASVPAGRHPGPGPSPMEAVQAALAACSGIDVVSILGKMRRPLTALRVEVEATRRAEEPRIYTRLVLVYHVDGPDLDAAAVGRAVSLSQDKYCSVAAMLRPAVELDYRIVLNGQAIGAKPPDPPPPPAAGAG
jgi:putative redox protein